jgi:hypothetical protein
MDDDHNGYNIKMLINFNSMFTSFQLGYITVRCDI